MRTKRGLVKLGPRLKLAPANHDEIKFSVETRDLHSMHAFNFVI